MKGRARTARVAVMAGFLFAAALLAMAVPAHPATPAPTPTDPTPEFRTSHSVSLNRDEVLIGAYVQIIQAIDPATNSFMADL